MLLLLPKRNICSAIFPIFSANPCNYASKSNPKPINSVMVDYLVASFGFSPDKALKVSKPIAHLNSPDKPEAVRRFLNQHDFFDAQLKTLITLHPNLLYASPESTLEPNLQSLRDIGLSASTLTQLILAGPSILQINSAAPRIKFWRDFFQGDHESLVRAFRRNSNLGAHDIRQRIAPKISLFRSHGLSTHDIQRILLKAPRSFLNKLSAVEEALVRAKNFGFQPESRMFIVGLHAMLSVSRGLFQKKMELLKSFGWSENEFIVVLRKAPNMITLTENHLRMKMDFLMGEARCDPSYIASNPVLMTMSVEKRLRPRLHVLHLLESKGLSSKLWSFAEANTITNEDFIKKFILPHNEEISGLHEEFLSALCKAPAIATLTEDNLRDKMNFLIGEAKCDPSYIASCPVCLC